MSNNDYYVVTSKRGEYPDRWSWEIRRRSKPLGVKLMAHGFQSDSAAQVAGKRALDEFLSALSKEERRRKPELIRLACVSCQCRLPESGESLSGLWRTATYPEAGRSANESTESLGASIGARRDRTISASKSRQRSMA